MVAGQRFGGDFHAAAANGPFELRERFAQRVAFQPGADFVLDSLRLGGIQKGQTIGAERIENNDAWHGMIGRFGW